MSLRDRFRRRGTLEMEEEDTNTGPSTWRTFSGKVQPSIRTTEAIKQESGEVNRALNELSRGTTLYKVKSHKRLLERDFFLDMKNMTMYYEGSRKRNKDTHLPISKIREVREGEKDYSKKTKELEGKLCFFIILKSTKKIMMAETQKMRDKWVRALRYAMVVEQSNIESDKSVREAFNMADKNGDGHLDFEEVLKLLKLLNTDIKKKYAKEMFDDADTNKNNGNGKNSVLDREEFVKFYNRLTKRVEVERLFLEYSGVKGFFLISDLLNFLKEAQKDLDADEEMCRNIVDQFEPDGTSSKKQDKLTLVGFRRFLTSEGQQIFNPAHKTVYQDMSRPMTHYFIASSHNTYLAEDQLTGSSTVEMYITALQKGCRCVELDCWDGSDGEPVIYHGHTLTSKISFQDAIKAINDYAFHTSPYPVTLSLENHCSVEQQQVMADTMMSVFGDKIWSPQTDLITTPSPEELKNKFIIKGKRLPRAIDQNDDVSDEDEAADLPQQTDADGVVPENNDKAKTASDGHKKIKLNPALSKMTSMQSVGFKTVESSGLPDEFFTVISLGESKVEKLMQNSAFGLNVMTHHRLIRTYPSGTRTDSSNYNPVPMWNHGCQVVALNYQTGGEAMQLNHGRFMDNGGIGYVLKPSFLMSDEMFGIVNGSEARSLVKILKVKIISGFQIPKPNERAKGEVIDPFVKVEVFGVPSDMSEFKTKVVHNNGFNPRWEETHEFRLHVPELALLRFTVKDEDRGFDDFIGYYCLPVLSIQEGYRHFPLYDKNGNPYSQSLIFTHVTLTNV